MKTLSGGVGALLVDYEQTVGEGFDKEWRGVLFCRTYPELEYIIDESSKLFRAKAKYNINARTWTFPGGETLKLRRIMRPEQYWDFHGQVYPWIGFDRVHAWPNPDWYNRLLSLNRSADSEVEKLCRVRTTTEEKENE